MNAERPGYVTSTKFTLGEINGIRVRLGGAWIHEEASVGFIQAVADGEGMIVTIENFGTYATQTVITNVMLEAAEIRDGFLCFKHLE